MAKFYPDISILFVTAHGATQVLRPRLNELDHDGLDQYRHWIYVTIVLIPVVLSTIPFAITNDPYQYSGAFCQLPVRPIWYRLAFAWIPRYVITLFTLAVTIYVYVYVGVKLRGFTRTSTDVSLASRIPPSIDIQRTRLSTDVHGWRNALMIFNWAPHSTTSLRRSSAQDLWQSNAAKERKSSDAQPLNVVAPLQPKSVDELRRASTVTNSSKTRQVDDSRRPSTISNYSGLTYGTDRSGGSLSPVKEYPTREQPITLPPLSESLPGGIRDAQQRGSGAEEASASAVVAGRVMIQRQLRNNFIYPLIYLATWTVPCIATCMQFTPRYARSTPPWLGVLSILSLTSTGTVECLAFLWKEKPWRTQTGGASTSAGRTSRRGMWWWCCYKDRRASTVSGSSGGARPERDMDADVEHSCHGSDRPYVSRSRSSDQQKMARQRALERLALEQQDRSETAAGERPASGANSGHEGRKEWFDVRRFSSFAL